MNGDVFLSNVETDKQFLHAINQYRNHFGKDTLVWDKETHETASHHSQYMLLTQHIHHIETKEVKGFKRMQTLQDRIDHFIGKTEAAGENVIGGTYAILTGDSTLGDFVRKVYKKELINCSTLERIMYKVIYDWSNSPKHNENLLSTDFRLGAVSLFYQEPVIFHKAIFFSGKEIQEQKLFCTFNGIRF